MTARQTAVHPEHSPDATGIGLALRQERHGVVAMQSLGGQNMRLDQSMDGLERCGAGSDLVDQGREAEIDPFSGERSLCRFSG